MKKAKTKFLFILSCIFGILTCFLIGFSQWDIKLTTTTPPPIQTTPVCYVDNTYFTTIEDGLNYANSISSDQNRKKIFVIPNLESDVVITKKCEIGPYVSLILPYDGETYEEETVGILGSATASSGFANDSLRRNRIVIKSQQDNTASLTIKGELIIGGKKRSSYPQSCTSGDFVEIVLEENAIIDCYGTINCNGYIKESSDFNNSRINIHSGGKLIQPIVIYDWSSVSNASTSVNSNIFPFNQFDFPQVSPELYIYDGATMTASCWVWGDKAKDVTGSGNLIGKYGDGLITPAENSSKELNYIVWKNTDISAGNSITTTTSNHKINACIYGEWLFDHLELEITPSGLGLKIPINSESFYLPFSYLFNIEIMENSKVTLLKDIKFLPGSTFINHQGATADVRGNLAIYSSNKNTNNQTIRAYSNNSPSSFINDGTMYLQKGIAGTIQASKNGNENTTLTTYSINTNLVVKEIYNSAFDNTDFTFVPSILVYDDTSSNFVSSTPEEGYIYSWISNNNNYGWRKNEKTQVPSQLNITVSGMKDEFSILGIPIQKESKLNYKVVFTNDSSSSEYIEQSGYSEQLAGSAGNDTRSYSLPLEYSYFKIVIESAEHYDCKIDKYNDWTSYASYSSIYSCNISER